MQQLPNKKSWLDLRGTSGAVDGKDREGAKGKQGPGHRLLIVRRQVYIFSVGKISWKVSWTGIDMSGSRFERINSASFEKRESNEMEAKS